MLQHSVAVVTTPVVIKIYKCISLQRTMYFYAETVYKVLAMYKVLMCGEAGPKNATFRS